LSPPRGADRHMLRVHLCPVFVRRNTNRLPEDEVRGWPEIVARAVREGAAEAGISVNAAWGSNFTGAFDLRQRMSRLEQQYYQWQSAGIPVRKVWLGDPMGWNSPWAVAEQIGQITRTWPEITDFHLHLHDTRGLAMSSAVAAAQTLTESHRLILDASLGGVGGCPYCGNGRATGMIPTEDLAHMLEFAGIDTGIDLARLIEASVLAEQIFGRRLHSRITHAGPTPTRGEYFAEDLGIVETHEEAAHFRLGPKVVRRPLPNLPARH
jgi:hydroxymethylglutaryl-CoA lyase